MAYDPNPYNIMRVFGTFSSDIDLTAQSGCPKAPPHQLDIYNNQVDDQDIVLRGPDDTDVAVTIAPAFTRIIYNTKTHQIRSSGTGTIEQVTAYWRHDGSTKLNA